MPTNFNKSKEFKIKLVRNDISMLDFCSMHKFSYMKFNQSINGFIPMCEEYQVAINEFMEKN